MLKADFLIIGGGVIGLSIARELRLRGAGRVVILERGRIGMEASWAAAGMLAPQAEADRADDFFEFCSASNEMYPRFAAELFDETGVDIELDRAGALFLAFSGQDSAELQRRYEWQSSVGMAVERLSAEETLRREPLVSPLVRDSLFFPKDGQVENRQLVEALAASCRGLGVEISENAPAARVVVENGKVTAVLTEKEKVGCGRVILAAGAWTSLVDVGERKLNVPIKPIRGQMISFPVGDGRLSHVIYSHRGYLVPRADGRVLAGATVEDVGFDKQTTERGVGSLCGSAVEIAPTLAGTTPADRWAGLRPFAGDGLPVLGEVAGVEGLTIATGHYRNGILLAPITAQAIANALADNVRSKYLELFGPSRFAAARA